MKKLVLIVCAMFAFNTFAQTQVEFDEKLLFRYTQEQLEEIAEIAPSKIEYLNFYVNNAYYFRDVDFIPEVKQIDYPNVLDLISLPDGYELENEITTSNFNVLMYALEFSNNSQKAYRFGDENVLVIIRSKEEIYSMFNQRSK